ncbi:ATP-binding protein [Microvirga roseola]|uniref:ATP-binding protein n=1 Tax=Microvirga roseola TaxID=2883126 RepID=UPI001E367DD1|nr:adenylate/guanylate cyclase domain-containing protein [Microvirga roseola]
MVKPAGEAPSSLRTVTAIAGERRQVTALFYDIVGSTHLLQKLDPEDFALLQRQVHNRAASAISSNGGYFDRLQGDGGSAYFGLPVSQEDAAECAVASALELVEWSRTFNENAEPGEELRVRVGIATGMVIVSDVDGSALPGPKEIIGIAPTLASRIQAEADPNSVLVSDATYRLTRGAFEYEFTGERSLKGFEGSVRLWRLIAQRPLADRFSSSHQTLTPFVDRIDELEACRQRWAEAREGRGQVIVIAGEAGIGKSRLVAELSHDVSCAGCETWILQCLPRGNNRPLHPFTDALRLRIRNDAPGPSALNGQDIRAFLHSTGAEISDSTIAMLTFLSGGRSDSASHIPFPDLSADDAKRQAIDAVFEVLTALSRRKPQLVVLEDIHWADTLTLATIAELTSRIRDEKVLAILTTRDTSPPLPVEPNVMAMSLPRLEAQDTPHLLEPIWSNPLPEGLAHFIHEKSEGVPLFVEELATLLKERFGGTPSTAKDWRRTLKESNVASLQELLSARLAGLGEARRVAQVASVLGREFQASLLSHLIDESASGMSLDRFLTELVQAGIVRRQGAGSEISYRFRHILLQEAAYESLLKADRREIHKRIVELVEAGVAPPPPDEIMAWHCEQAGRPLDAASYAVRAAENCAMRSAIHEAEQLLAMAENNLSRCEPGAETEDVRLQLLATKGPVAISTFGKGSPEARTIYDQAIAICRQREIDDREKWFPLYWGWWYTAPDGDTNRSRSRILIEDLDRAKHPEVRLQSLHCAWAANFHAGQHGLCMDCIERGLTLYDPERGRVSRVRYGGHDANVCGLGERAQLLWLTGDPSGADESMAKALEWAEAIDHPGSLCHALDIANLLSCYKRDIAGTIAFSRRLRELGETYERPEIRAKSRIFGGWGIALQGQVAEGLQELEEGLEIQQATGTDEDVPVYRSLWAELLVLSGRAERALSVLDEAIRDAEATGNLVWAPELYRQRASVREQAQPDRSASLQDLERALALAETQGAKALAERARADAERLQDQP